jgi:hypothetical protein
MGAFIMCTLQDKAWRYEAARLICRGYGQTQCGPEFLQIPGRIFRQSYNKFAVAGASLV